MMPDPAVRDATRWANFGQVCDTPAQPGLHRPDWACTVQDMDTTEVIADLIANPETTVNELAEAADRYGFDPGDVLALI